MSATLSPFELLVNVAERRMTEATLEPYAADITCLTRLGAIAGAPVPVITPVGARMIEYMKVDNRMGLRQARVLVAASQDKDSCFREASIAVAVFLSGGGLFIRPGQEESVVSNFRQPDDKSDVEVVVRVYQQLVDIQRTCGSVESECERLGLNVRVFDTANRLHAKLLRLNRALGRRVNEHPAPCESLSWAFLTGFGELLTYGDEPKHLDSLDDSFPALMLVRESILHGKLGQPFIPVCLRDVQIRRHSGRSTLPATLVTAAMPVTLAQLQRYFGDRLTLSEHDHHWKNSRGSAFGDWDYEGLDRGPDRLLSTQCWSIDGRTVHRVKGDALPGALTQRFLAEKLLRAVETPSAATSGQYAGLEALVRLCKVRQRGADIRPAEPAALQRLICERMGVSGDSPVNITWDDLVTLTGEPELETKVRQAETIYPDELVLHGCKLPVAYASNGGIVVSVSLPQAAPALREMRPSDFPECWEGRCALSVMSDQFSKVGLSWGLKPSLNGRVHSDLALDAVRVMAAAQPLRTRSVCLPSGAAELLRTVQVSHPGGRSETVYVVNSVPGYDPHPTEHTDRNVAFAAALGSVRLWLQQQAFSAEGRYLLDTDNEERQPEGSYDSMIDALLQQLTELNADALAAAANSVCAAVHARLRSLFVPRSDCRRELLLRAQTMWALAKERGVEDAVRLASIALEQLRPGRADTFALSTFMLDTAEGNLRSAEALVPERTLLTDRDGQRLRLRNAIASLQQRAKEAGVKGTVKSAVKDLLGGLSRQLDADKVEEVEAALPSATAAIDHHCKNPEPVVQLRGGLRGLEPRGKK